MSISTIKLGPNSAPNGNNGSPSSNLRASTTMETAPLLSTAAGYGSSLSTAGGGPISTIVTIPKSLRSSTNSAYTSDTYRNSTNGLLSSNASVLGGYGSGEADLSPPPRRKSPFYALFSGLGERHKKALNPTFSSSYLTTRGVTMVADNVSARQRTGVRSGDFATFLVGGSCVLRPGMVHCVASSHERVGAEILHVLSGTRPCTSGMVTADGIPVSASSFRHAVGAVESRLPPYPYLSNRRNVSIELKRRRSCQSSIEAKERVEDVMQFLGVDGDQKSRLNTPFEHLMLQMARELVADPPVLFVRSPVVDVEYHHHVSVAKALKRIATTLGKTVILSTSVLPMSLFERLDTLMLVGEGGHVFCSGEVSSVVGYFASLKLTAASFMPPVAYDGEEEGDGNDGGHVGGGTPAKRILSGAHNTHSGNSGGPAPCEQTLPPASVKNMLSLPPSGKHGDGPAGSTISSHPTSREEESGTAAASGAVNRTQSDNSNGGVIHNKGGVPLGGGGVLSTNSSITAASLKEQQRRMQHYGGSSGLVSGYVDEMAAHQRPDLTDTQSNDPHQSLASVKGSGLDQLVGSVSANSPAKGSSADGLVGRQKAGPGVAYYGYDISDDEGDGRGNRDLTRVNKFHDKFAGNNAATRNKRSRGASKAVRGSYNGVGADGQVLKNPVSQHERFSSRYAYALRDLPLAIDDGETMLDIGRVWSEEKEESDRYAKLYSDSTQHRRAVTDVKTTLLQLQQGIIGGGGRAMVGGSPATFVSGGGGTVNPWLTMRKRPNYFVRALHSFAGDTLDALNRRENFAASIIMFCVLLLSALFVERQDNDQGGMQNKRGIVFFLFLVLMEFNALFVSTYLEETECFVEQRNSGTANATTQTLLVVVKLAFARVFILSVIAGFIFYAGQGLGWTFVLFWGVTSFMHSLLLYTLTALVMRPRLVLLLSFGFTLYSALFSGFLINLTTVHQIPGYVSAIRWGYGAVIHDYLNGKPYDCDASSIVLNTTNTSYCYTGDQYLELEGLSSDSTEASLNILVITSGIVIVVLWFRLHFMRKSF